MEVLEGFCVLEGLDGSGTTTQLQLLGKCIGERCFLTCEPTTGAVGECIRAILRGEQTALPRTIALLFAADRTEHVAEIRRRIGQGRLVVSDRYVFSSLAFQSLETPFDVVADLNREFPLPEHLVFLDTPVEVCQARVGERSRRELYESVDIQHRILANYERSLKLFADTAMKILRVDGTASPDSICREICSTLQS